MPVRELPEQNSVFDWIRKRITWVRMTRADTWGSVDVMERAMTALALARTRRAPAREVL